MDQYIIDLANEVRKILGVYEDRKQVVQKFEDEKPLEDFEHDKKKLLKAFQKEEKMLLKEDKLLLNRQKLLKSFDDRKLLDKCEAIVC